jgi:dihydroorotase
MLELAHKGIFTVEDVVARMSHGPADCFNIEKRGYIKEGFYADLAMVNLNLPDSTSTTTPAYKCGWSPFEGMVFSSSIINTMVNGTLVVENGKLTGNRNAKELRFDR